MAWHTGKVNSLPEPKFLKILLENSSSKHEVRQWRSKTLVFTLYSVIALFFLLSLVFFLRLIKRSGGLYVARVMFKFHVGFGFGEC